MEHAAAGTPISVIVLNFNRKAELRETLQSILLQDYPSLEILVADNASTDGSIEMVENDFPRVRLVKMPENIGTRARRKAAEVATGDYVVMYDDDSGPSTSQDMRRIASYFDEHPEASVLCTAIYRTRSSYFETWNWEAFAVGGDAENGYEGLFIHGSGTAYRRRDLLQTDAYNNELFWGDEEFDAALNFISKGFRIFFHPAIVTDHRASFVNRNKARFYRVVTRNHLMTLAKYFRGTEAFIFSFREILYHTLLARLDCISVWLGVWDAWTRRSPADRRCEISPFLRPYIKEVRERRYPGLWAWVRQQQDLRRYRKTKAY